MPEILHSFGTDGIVFEGARKFALMAPVQIIDDQDRLTASNWAQDVLGPFVGRPEFGVLVGRLVEAGGTNRNGHQFTLDDLSATRTDLLQQPINILHRAQHTVGSIVGAELLYPTGEAAADTQINPFIDIASLMWRWVYTDEWRAVQDAHEKGALAWSMEAVPESLTCPECDGTFPYRGAQHASYCDHLQASVTAPKQLNKPHWVGAALVLPPAQPAWRGASISEAASEQVERNLRWVDPSSMDPVLWESMMRQVAHQVEPVLGRRMSRRTRKAAELNLATPDGKFEIHTAGDLHKAIRVFKRAMSPTAPPNHRLRDPEAARKHIVNRAKQLKMEDLLDPQLFSEPVTAELKTGAPGGGLGAILALVPPADIAERIAALGTQPASEIHLTLDYLGKPVDGVIPETGVTFDDAAAGVAEFASVIEPFDVSVQGFGTFLGTPDGDCTYLSVDSSVLPGLAADARVLLGSPSEHGFVPHITVAYHQSGEGPVLTADDLAGMSWTVDHLELWWAGEHYSFPLGGDDEPDDGPDDEVESAGSYSAKERRDLLKKGHALPPLHEGGEPRYPVENNQDLFDAIQSIGRTKPADRDKVLRYLLGRAKDLGASQDAQERIKQLLAVEIAADFHTLKKGTKVTYHYRSAIGHGTIEGVHKLGTSHANTEYSIRQSDGHPGEPAIVYHYGRVLTVVH